MQDGFWLTVLTKLSAVALTIATVVGIVALRLNGQEEPDVFHDALLLLVGAAVVQGTAAGAQRAS